MVTTLLCWMTALMAVLVALTCVLAATVVWAVGRVERREELRSMARRARESRAGGARPQDARGLRAQGGGRVSM